MNRELESSIRTKMGFTEDDLKANHNGKMTDNQRHKLFAERQIWVLHAKLVCVIAVVIIVVIILNSGTTPTGKVLYATIVGMVLVLDVIYARVNWRRFSADIKTGIILESQGRLEPITYLGRSVRYYDLRVKATKFSIDKILFELLITAAKEHPFCIVYYTPKSHTPLSIELLP